MWNGIPVVVFGTSGFAREVVCIIEDINKQNYTNQFDILGFVSENDDDIGSCIGNYKIVASDNTFSQYSKEYRQLAVVLAISSDKVKRKIYDRINQCQNIIYPNIISPYANIGNIKSIEFGEGNIIAAGCTMTCYIKIGSFNIFNINCTIGHDCVIGNYCTINPLTSVSGNVKIEDNTLLGAGSSIMQGVTIGADSSIGLGAFIVKNVEQDSTMICSPAKKMERNKNE